MISSTKIVTNKSSHNIIKEEGMQMQLQQHGKRKLVEEDSKGEKWNLKFTHLLDNIVTLF